jgi:AraC-like DNA-binding protein
MLPGRRPVRAGADRGCRRLNLSLRARRDADTHFQRRDKFGNPRLHGRGASGRFNEWKKRSGPPIRVPAAGILTRKSSDLLALKHKGMTNCLRFIWEHSDQNISVKDLVSVAAMSRRGLHKAFQDNVGRTPGQELQRVRIERTKRLLAESDNKVEVLATMCGYQSANSFCVAFKQATGISPKQFRDSESGRLLKFWTPEIFHGARTR